MRRHRLLAAAIALVTMLVVPAAASAGIGDLDPAFDEDGKRVEKLFDSVVKVAVQPDGKIVAVGPLAAGDFKVVRLNRDGSLDLSFDGDGMATTDFGGIDWSSAVAIQPDGKIVVAGVSGDGRAGDDFALARYNSNGSPDNEFSGDGKLTTDVSKGGGDTANTIAIYPDGRILAAGYGDRDPDDPEGPRLADFALARYLPDGTPDGSRITEFDAALGEGIVGVSLLPDGRILAGGAAGDSSVSDFAFARYDSELAPDTSFGTEGKLVTGIARGTYETAFGMATQIDGDVVLVGEVASSPTAPRDIAVARYDIDGVPDPGFDDDGALILDLGPPSSAQGVVVQPDGKLVVAGRVGDVGSMDFAVVRLDPNGAPDSTFADDGIVTTDFGDDDYANSVARGEDGMLVVSGASGLGSPVPSAFARYVGAPPETSISSGPSGYTNDPTPTFGFESNVFGASIDCRLLVAAFAPCLSPFSAGPLADGSYSLEARASDASGTLDPTPAARSFTVDTVAPDTTILSAPSGGTFDTTPTFQFSSEVGAGFGCSLDAAPFSVCSSPYTSPPLTPGRHTFEVRAVDLAGNLDPSPAAVVDPETGQAGFEVVDSPILGKDFNLEELSGDVYVSVPGSTTEASIAQRGPYSSPVKGRRFVPVEQVRQIPIGSLVDTRFGVGRITTARTIASGRLQSGKFGVGVFQVLQSRARRARGLTEMRLKGSSFTRCRPRGRGTQAGAAQLSQRTIRRLRANARGRFRTRGRHSAATVRGTVWVTADRCDGTLTKVNRGKVAVRDFRRKRTITLTAGKSYLAKAP